MNILLIEDEELLLKALSFRLTQRGHKVYLADNGRKAVDIVMGYPVDLIICDLMTPIISGVTFLSMREKFMSANVPVIVISSLEEAEDILKKLDIEFKYFLKKPIQFEKLMDLIFQIQLKQEAVKTSAQN